MSLFDDKTRKAIKKAIELAQKGELDLRPIMTPTSHRPVQKNE